MSLEKRFKVGGRPLKFETPKDLVKVIDGYLSNTEQEELSVTGLALVVGSKQLIQDYEKREGYDEVVKRAKLIIENAYEMSLRKNGRSGDIFALKNFGWKDAPIIDQSQHTHYTKVDINVEEFNRKSTKEKIDTVLGRV